jgi:hypothetical protein
MNFDWNKYLELAKKLAAHPDDASLRSAISRSYYCIFNLAMSRAEFRGYRNKTDETGSSHDLLWQLYERNSDDTACSKLATMGPRMKRRRVKADYRASIHNLAEEVKDAIEDADQCISLLSSLPNDRPINKARTWSF